MSHSKNRLRELRNSRNMSGVDVAEAINITPQYYYELEKGEKRLNEDLLRKLAEYFNTTTDYILGRSNDPTPATNDTKDAPIAFMGNTEGLDLGELEEIINRAVKKALEEREKERKE